MLLFFKINVCLIEFIEKGEAIVFVGYLSVSLTVIWFRTTKNITNT